MSAGCNVCHHIRCVCAIRAKHPHDGCPARLAAIWSPTERCEAHGVKVCKICEPCECPKASATA